MLVLLWVLFDANRGPGEVLQVITKLNEEDAIVTVCEFDLLLDLWCPQLALVRPVALPLARAPRVPQLQQVDFLALASDLMDRDERVSVTLNNTLLLPIVIAGRTCCHHCEVSLIGKLQHFEKLVRVLDAIVIVRLRRNTHDVRGCEAG